MSVLKALLSLNFRWSHRHGRLLLHRSSFVQSVSSIHSDNAEKPLNLSPVSSTALETNREVEKCYNKLDRTFRNTKEAFRSKTNFELFRAWLVLKLCTFNYLVEHNDALMKLGRRTLGQRIFKAVMRGTFYGHFVAGENEAEISPKVQKMSLFGVKSILDYSAEKDLSSEEAEKSTMDGATEWQKQLLPPPEVSREVAQIQEALGPQANVFTRYKPHKEFADRRKGAVARSYFYSGEEDCDRNAEIFCNSIRAVSTTTGSAGLAAIKLTALGRPQLLLQLSEVLEQTWAFYKLLTGSTWENLVTSRLSRDAMLNKLREFGIQVDSAAVQEWFSRVDFDSDGFVDIYEWGQLLEDKSLTTLFKVVNLRTGQMENLIKTLTLEEEVQFTNMIGRLRKIANCARENNVRVMVDAEQTYFQPAINRLTLEMMRKYNKDGAVIFGTYQCYLKSVLNTLRLDLHLAEREDFYFGAKIVRGAYMDQERKRAKALGYDDPIQPTYEATSASYRAVLDEIVAHVKRRDLGKVSAMAATHNEEAVRYAVELMRKHNIGPSQKIICFAQLYGMCDQVSFSLGQAGYSVYKYVPYGPVEEVLPYLSRRAIENSSLIAKSKVERALILQELKRRVAAGQLFYDPMQSLPDLPRAPDTLATSRL